METAKETKDLYYSRDEMMRLRPSCSTVLEVSDNHPILSSIVLAPVLSTPFDFDQVRKDSDSFIFITPIQI